MGFSYGKWVLIFLMPFAEKRGNLMYITIIYDNFYGLDMGNCGNVKC